MKDSEKLMLVGESLFGRSWQAQTADYLKVDRRRITHWLDETRPIPLGIWSELLDLANQRHVELSHVIQILNKQQ